MSDSPQNLIPKGRIELPENWVPEGVICAVIPIPDDPQYLSMLVGIVDRMRWSAEYARDATASGAATVARTWDAALNSRPIMTIDCEGVMTLFDVRQKPGEPCLLEKSTDGGETWTVWADLTLCPPTVAIGGDGKTIIWWCPTCGPDGGPGWTPILPPGDEYDPAFDDPQTDHTGWVDPESDPACVYAANAMEAFKSVMERIDYGLEIGALSQIVWVAANGIYGIANRLLSKKVQQILLEIVENVSVDYSEWHADYIGFDWQEMVDQLCCFYSDNGTVSEESFNQGMAGLESKSGPVWNMLKLLLNIVGPVGLNNAATYAGIQAADCDCDCEWSYTFDFTASDGDGVGDTHVELVSGTYIPGVGWASIPSQLFVRFVRNEGAFFQVTYLECHYTSDSPGHRDGEKIQLGTQVSPWAGGPDNPYYSGGEHAIHDAEMLSAGHDPQYTDRVEFFAFQWTNWPFEPQEYATVVLQSLTVVGKGFNPFA